MNAVLGAVAAAAGDGAIVAAAADSQLAPVTSTTVVDGRPLAEEFAADEVKAALRADAEMVSEEVPPAALDLPPDELRGAIEALLLVATKPLTIERLGKLLPGADPAYLTGFLDGLADRYDDERRGWALRRIGSGYQLLTRPAFHPWVRQLERKELPTKLSRSAMETLAIIAYKQPVTRGEIEDIRGVQCGPMVRQLMDLKLVQVVGRKQELGNPLLYGTTDVFLDRFGLSSVDDLPKHHELGG
ncbi:MAG: SMC-Scp complex subunit ScpB [Planctomycetota bacterium]|jgi:segregation and condensation protein B